MNKTMNLYLTDEEYVRIRDSANTLGVTLSYIIRLILRDFYGLPTGPSGHAEIEQLSEC